MKDIKMNANGQIAIPEEIRKELGLNEHTPLSIGVTNGVIEIMYSPAEDDLAQLLENLPSEKVEIDKAGHYDPKKSPEYHKWMQEG